MKALPSLAAITIALSTACYAQHCPDPNSKWASIGGDTINGSVSLQQRPLKFAKVQLSYNSKVTWVGSTDDGGSFHVKGLRPGTYHLAVRGWGTTTIRINPALPKCFGSGQTVYYSVLLVDNGCIWTIKVMN